MLIGFLRFFYKHPSLIMLILLVIDGLVGWFLFSKYYLEVKERRVDVSKVIQIDKTLLENISGIWQQRENNLKLLPGKAYQDPFLSSDYKIPPNIVKPKSAPNQNGNTATSSPEIMFEGGPQENKEAASSSAMEITPSWPDG